MSPSLKLRVPKRVRVTPLIERSGHRLEAQGLDGGAESAQLQEAPLQRVLLVVVLPVITRPPGRCHHSRSSRAASAVLRQNCTPPLDPKLKGWSTPKLAAAGSADVPPPAARTPPRAGVHL